MKAKRKEHRKDRLYRAYVTDALKVIGNLNMRYEEIISETNVRESRTADEIVQHIKDKIRKVSAGG